MQFSMKWNKATLANEFCLLYITNSSFNEYTFASPYGNKNKEEEEKLGLVVPTWTLQDYEGGCCYC